MFTLKVGDEVYDRVASEELRKLLIILRNKALGADTFDSEEAVILSHAIAWMHAAMAQLDEEIV